MRPRGSVSSWPDMVGRWRVLGLERAFAPGAVACLVLGHERVYRPDAVIRDRCPTANEGTGAVGSMASSAGGSAGARGHATGAAAGAPGASGESRPVHWRVSVAACLRSRTRRSSPSRCSTLASCRVESCSAGPLTSKPQRCVETESCSARASARDGPRLRLRRLRSDRA